MNKEQILEKLRELESAICQLRDEKDSMDLNIAHCKVSEAVSALEK